jgi:sortase (surface protein transpeptidase)
MQQKQVLNTPKVSAQPVLEQTPVIQQTAETYIEGKPVHLQIPSVGINLSVAEGRFNAATGKWTLSNDKAHYAVKTPLSNNARGNTFVYGHNRKEVFRALPKIQIGAEATIVTQNGRSFVYVFKGAYETTPDDNSLFEYQGAPILTLQTCSGVWNQNRQLFTFELKEVL